MDASIFIALAIACAPDVHVDTVSALVRAESGFNPWAIGVVGGALLRQPRTRAEALATARALRAGGWNFSVGLGQINIANFDRLGLTLETAFDACTNLKAMQTVLAACYGAATAIGDAAPPRPTTQQAVLRRALSCYYSGNFTTGFLHGYVSRVLASAARARTAPSTPTQENS